MMRRLAVIFAAVAVLGGVIAAPAAVAAPPSKAVCSITSDGQYVTFTGSGLSAGGPWTYSATAPGSGNPDDAAILSTTSTSLSGMVNLNPGEYRLTVTGRKGDVRCAVAETFI